MVLYYSIEASFWKFLPWIGTEEYTFLLADFMVHLIGDSFASVNNELICASGLLADVCFFYIMLVLVFLALPKPVPCTLV